MDLAAAIAASRTHAGVDVAVVLVAELQCPCCRSTSARRLNEPPVPGPWKSSARRCSSCGATFRTLVVDGAELADLVAAAGRPAPPVAAAAPPPELEEPRHSADELRDEAERAAAERLTDEDRQLAANVLAGWRVRLAAVRAEKRMADDLPPTDEDLQLLELAARPVLGAAW